MEGSLDSCGKKKDLALNRYQRKKIAVFCPREMYAESHKEFTIALKLEIKSIMRPQSAAHAGFHRKSGQN